MKLHIYQGATFNHLCTVQRTAEGDPMDLTGATISSELRKRVGGELIATFTVEDVDLANGEFRLVLTDETTAAMPRGNALLDILIDWPDGSAQRSDAVRTVTHSRITE